MAKSKSHEVLQAFLEKHYMKGEGVDSLDVAIRDCLTDLFHIAARETGTNLHQRLLDAESVWKEEATGEFLADGHIRYRKGQSPKIIWPPRWNPKTHKTPKKKFDITH